VLLRFMFSGDDGIDTSNGEWKEYDINEQVPNTKYIIHWSYIVNRTLLCVDKK
jgi:hypothetical protein